MFEELNDSVCVNWQGKLRRVFHWGPLIALCTIFYIAYISLKSSMWIAPLSTSLLGCTRFAVVAFLLYMILNSYFCALFIGPGFVPLRWKPSDPKAINKLQFCNVCNGYKPPRAHHCRTCNRCVMKMDHHCPWLNTCCGHLNHGYFMHFLLWVPIGCITCTVILGITVYRDWVLLPLALFHHSMSEFTSALIHLFLAMFAFGLAVGVTIAVGILAVYQLLSISKNQTGIESWIVAKANHWRADTGAKPFVYPYDLGRTANLFQVLTWSGRTIGDGFHWPLREGCGEYDLTLEQIRQKHFKQQIKREFQVVRAYNGRCYPCCSQGCRVALDTPYPDEARIPVRVGDLIRVTRGTRHWLYGQIYVSKSESSQNGTPAVNENNPRGWFPRSCAVEITDSQTNQRPKRE